jgi:hypothetical protein
MNSVLGNLGNVSEVAVAAFLSQCHLLGGTERNDEKYKDSLYFGRVWNRVLSGWESLLTLHVCHNYVVCVTKTQQRGDYMN